VDLSFGAAIVVGLLGSSHCIGMCGGIVAALNMGVSDQVSKKPASLFVYHLGYNSGRIVSYLLVGLVAGSLGAGLTELGVSPVFGKLFAAGFMIALGLYLANWWRSACFRFEIRCRHFCSACCGDGCPAAWSIPSLPGH
jgi:sulfite exporter TauE/SafE